MSEVLSGFDPEKIAAITEAQRIFAAQKAAQKRREELQHMAKEPLTKQEVAAAAPSAFRAFVQVLPYAKEAILQNTEALSADHNEGTTPAKSSLNTMYPLTLSDGRPGKWGVGLSEEVALLSIHITHPEQPEYVTEAMHICVNRVNPEQSTMYWTKRFDHLPPRNTFGVLGHINDIGRELGAPEVPIPRLPHQ